MIPTRWYSKMRLFGWLAWLSWRSFCWATDYPRKGHVCDWAHYDPLPCVLVDQADWPTEIRDWQKETEA